MAVLKIRPRDPEGARWAQVIVQLCDAAGKPVQGYTGSGEVVAAWTGSTDSVGVLDVDLVPNEQIEPENTGYLVRIGTSSHVIVKADHPQTVWEALATDLGPLSPVVGAQGPPGAVYVSETPILLGTDGHIYAVAPAGPLVVEDDVVHALVPSAQLTVADGVLLATIPGDD